MVKTDVEILLVEDNPNDIELTLHVMHKEQICDSIQIVRDGEEALDFLLCRGAYAERSFDRPPKLVVLDLKLPKVGGFEVLRTIKADVRTRAIPVTILTSSNEERDLVDGYRLGANSYLQKPVDFGEFQQTVKQLGMYWLTTNQSPPSGAFSRR